PQPPSVNVSGLAQDTRFGAREWPASLFNNDDIAHSSPHICVDKSTATLTPPVDFPISGDAAQVAANDVFQFDRLFGESNGNSLQDGISSSPGFDASRSFDTTRIPPGGGVESLSTTILL